MSVWTAASASLVSARWLRGLLAIWLASSFGIFAFAGTMGLAKSRWVAVFISIGIAAVVAWIAWNRSVLPLDEKATSPALTIVFVLAAILSLVQLARLSVFIVNPAAVSYAHPVEGLTPRHLCMTAYYVAAQSVATVPNIYDIDQYSVPIPNSDRRKPRPIGTFFDTDVYEYPPTFLLLPRTLAILTPQVLNFRMLWFGLYGSVMLIGLLAVARLFDPVVGTRVLLLSPLVLGADITIVTLQLGNLQAAVFVLAMLAMVFFTQRRYAAGGALLAFATVSKMFPGMLIVYLAARREWRALAWTVGSCAALVGISFLDTGRTPYIAFLHHLPRLLSGEAFGPLHRATIAALNLSVPGLLFKLKLFGLPGGSYEVMKIVGTIYTLILLAAIVMIAMRRLNRNEQPLIWLTILILGSLRSPFLPGYGLFPVLWLLILLAARVAPAVRTLCLMLVAWVVLNFSLPVFSGLDPRLLTAVTLVLQAIIAVLLVLALRQRQESLLESPVMQSVGSPS
ncbi:MAG TPA: glycosyltransferase family 87 protein [Edaphobacter sp.]